MLTSLLYSIYHYFYPTNIQKLDTSIKYICDNSLNIDVITSLHNYQDQIDNINIIIHKIPKDLENISLQDNRIKIRCLRSVILFYLELLETNMSALDGYYEYIVNNNSDVEIYEEYMSLINILQDIQTNIHSAHNDTRTALVSVLNDSTTINVAITTIKNISI